MSDLETLRLVYADLINERDRLRDARRSITTQLGPLPASAGLIIGLFAAFGDIESGAHDTPLRARSAAIPTRNAGEHTRAAAKPLPQAHQAQASDPQKGTIYFPRRSGSPRESPSSAVATSTSSTTSNRSARASFHVQVLLGAEVVYLVLITALRPHIT